MTETLVLPSQLPGRLDLADLNARLKAGTVVLDWSDVEEAPGEALQTLLADLELDTHADRIGVDSVPDALAQTLGDLLEANTARLHPPEPKKPKRKKKAKAKKGKPATWTAPKGDDGSVASTETVTNDGDDADPPEPVAPPLLSTRTPVEIRAALEEKVLRDLLGPAEGPEEEVAENKVSDRYLVGTLAPQGQVLPAEEQDPLASDGESDNDDGQPDTQAAGRFALLPSSLGFSFCVSADTKQIQVTARWGRYLRMPSEHLVDSDDKPLRVWKRFPVEATSPPITLQTGPIDDWSPDAVTPQVRVRGLVRQIEGNDDWIVTLFLVNGQQTPEQNRDEAWLFQTELKVASPDKAPVFVRRRFSRPGQNVQRPPVDERILNMLYRRTVEFAIGHGVSVHAEVDEDDSKLARRLMTRPIPAYEVPQTGVPTSAEIPELEEIELDMKSLAILPTSELVAKLEPLIEAYAKWIDEREQEAQQDPGFADYREEADTVLANCREAMDRIKAGIELLSTDNQAAESFRFMCKAMWLQRVHTRLAEARRRSEGKAKKPVDFKHFDEPGNRTWRPFQLAFILLNLPSVTDLHHSERSPESAAISDLLWFPTGGGKTEAYLGLATYVMALRRLQGTIEGRSGEHGVAVLMRYTLRLLTLQQFQRASALICACESIRRESLQGDRLWGETPFRIGLWVGKRATPNTTDQSNEAIRDAHGDGQRRQGSGGGRSGSPAQLVHCPWCGTKINPGRHIRVETFANGRGRTIQYCGDPLGRCLFSRAKSRDEGLPILVVDEEIYRNLPTLLIATVDKFAQMPWNGAVQTLFGQVDGRCERHGFVSPTLKDTPTHQRTRNGLFPPAKTEDFGPVRPPDLIIQDELHLISGPLGTLVGLYETAVDRLASWQVRGKWVRPKLIASTATTRRAPEQIHALFRRQVRIFPPPGLDAADNFFSRQRQASPEQPGRRYLGICAPGRRQKAALIRTYTALMSAAQALYEECGTRGDPWMTAVGYFNSMRELGGMRRLIDDDVTSRLQRMDRRGLAKRRINHSAVEEMTSRRSSSEIPGLLDRLETPFDPQVMAETREALKAGKKPTGKGNPLDALLATNMISVGVDVQRLGLMIVCGQPKTTAEYIQATSRVGRRFPGLVVTVYHWARPRDLSHYEQFEHYHATFYTHVEALSVTPFAPRALDRGLFGVLTSLIRLPGIEFNGNTRAAAVSRNSPVVSAAVEALVERAQAVSGSDQLAELVRNTIDSRLDLWEAEVRRSTSARPLGYREDKTTNGLLKTPTAEPGGEFTCLNSLRDVEPTVGLILRDGGLDDVPPFMPQSGGGTE